MTTTRQKVFVLAAVHKPWANETVWRLRVLEMLNDATKRNAEACGVKVVTKRDVQDFEFEQTYYSPNEAAEAAERLNFGVLSYQKLSAMARGKK